MARLQRMVVASFTDSRIIGLFLTLFLRKMRNKRLLGPATFVAGDACVPVTVLDVRYRGILQLLNSLVKSRNPFFQSD